MKKNILILYIITILLTLIPLYKMIDLIVLKKDIYNKSFETITQKIVSFPNSPRGRILDINGKVLVDNIGIPTLIYNARTSKEPKNEIQIALTLAEIIELPIKNSTTAMQKNFYLKLHDNGENLIKDEEWELYKKRKLTAEEIEILKRSRISDEMLSSLSENEQKASYIYYLMTTGYSYRYNIIKKDITVAEMAKLSEITIPGTRCEMSWERIYPYENVLRSILGYVGPITKELLNNYKDKVSLDSIVGISSLELKYDEFLRYQTSGVGYQNPTLVQKPYHVKPSGIHRWTFEEDRICCEKFLEYYVVKKSDMDTAQFIELLSKEVPDVTSGSLRMKVQNIKYLVNRAGFEDTSTLTWLSQCSMQCEKAFNQAVLELDI